MTKQYVLSVLFINNDKEKVLLILTLLNRDRITLIIIFINVFKN